MSGFAVIAARVNAHRDDCLFYGISSAVFAAGLVLLAQAPAPHLTLKAPPPAPVAIRIRQAPALEKQQVQTITAPKILPKPIVKHKVKKKHIVKKIVKHTPKPPPPDPAPVPEADTPPPEIITSNQTLDVPPPPPDAPPPPPTEDNPPPSQYHDAPNGDVVVLALKIDSNGNVLDVRVEIPSFNTMGDLSFVLGAKNAKYTHIDPPIPPGQTRWMELRIVYNDVLKNMLP